MTALQANIYEFDDFRLDAGARMLLRRGQPVPLTPRVFDTLLYLVHHHGTVLEKDDMMRAIWPDAVVEENNLNQNVSTLRRVFGENRGENRYIVTVPGRGYRFAAKVRVSMRNEEPEPVTVAAAKAIAVLPFANMSADPENEYFCDGLAEELLNALAKVEDLKVAARTSAFAFKGKTAPISEIAAALRVNTILEGSVRRSGNHLRVTVQLVNALDGYHLWSERYDCEMRDIFDIQDEITLAVVDALKVTLLGRRKAAVLKHYTASTEAYHLYLKGRYFWFKSSPQEFGKSHDYFQRAVEADPLYALGYFGLASYYGFACSWGMMSPREGWPQMEAATMKALALDNTLAELHHGLAALKWVYHRDWHGADQAFRRAIDLNSRIATIHSHYSIYLTVVARSDDAIAEGRLALELDPLSIRIHRNQAIVLYHARRYDEAVRQYSEALELDPGNAVLREELDDVHEHIGAHQHTADDRAMVRKRLAQLDERSKRSEYVPAAHFARAYLRLDEKAEAFRWLEKARDERNALSLLIATDPAYDSLRTDPRFAAIVQGMNLGRLG